MRVGVLHTAFLGDLATAGLLVDALRRSGHEVVLFSNRGGLALYANDARLAKRVEIRKGKGVGKIQSLSACAASLRGERLDALLVPHRSATSALLARASGATRTVGFSSASLPFLYDVRVPYPHGRHECLRLLDLASAAELLTPEVRAACEAHGAPVLDGSALPAAFFARFPELAAGAPYFVVSPGSVWPTKRYPVGSLARLVASRLRCDPGLRCVVSGGPSDQDALEGFFAAMAREHDAVSWSGRLLDARASLPLGELASVLARARFSVSNDSAPLHVACGVGTPVVGIYGPTSALGGLGPAGPRARAVTFADAHGAPLPCQPCSKHGTRECPQGHFRCMRDLPAETVEAAIDGVIK